MGDKNDKSGCSATRMTNAINLGTIQVRPQGECHDTHKCSWILCRIVNEASGTWGIFEEEIGSKGQRRVEWRWAKWYYEAFYYLQFVAWLASAFTLNFGAISLLENLVTQAIQTLDRI